MPVRGPSQLDARIGGLGRPGALWTDDGLENRRLLAAVRAGLLGADQPLALGRFALGAVLGAGGMGVVYRAYDRELDRSVAIKLLHRRIADDRLRDEARVLAQLDHPNILPVYDVGVHEGRTFLVMPCVDGGSLAMWSARETPSLSARLRAFAAAARGLRAAHRRGVVHGDFKADNVLVGRDGTVRVADFGLAEACHRRILGGTRSHAAPEQLRGEPVDARADVYAFCTALHHAVYGRLPAEDSAVLPRRPRISTALTAALRAGLRVDVDARARDLDALVEALEAQSSRRRTVLASSGLVGALALGTIATAPPSRAQRCVEHRPVWVGAADLERVSAGLAAVDRPWTVVVDTHVREQLRAREQAGAELWRQACAAVGDDAAFACLRERSDELRALVDQLASGDLRASARAVQALQSLPHADGCLAATQLAAVDPRVAELRARARVATELELVEVAEAAVSELLALARRDGSAGVEAEARLRLGTLARLQGRPSEAWRQFEAAYLQAFSADQADLAAQAASALVFLAASDPALAPRGRRWLRDAWAALARGEDDPMTRSAVLNDEGSLLRAQGEFEPALAAYREAEWVRRGLVELPDHRVGLMLQNQGNVLFDLERFDEGIIVLRDAVAMQEAAIGSDHPALAQGYNNLGAAYKRRGELELAAVYLERARASFAEQLGEHHPQVARTSSNLGSLALDRGDAVAAMRHHRRALEILESSLGPDHLDVAVALANLAAVHEHLGELDDARVVLERSLVIRDAALGSEHSRSFGVHLRLCAPAMAAHDPPAAQRHLAAAMAIAARDSDVAAAQRMLLRSREASILLALGQPARAVGVATDALALDDGGSADVRAEASLTLARALRAANRGDARAIELATTARELLSTAGPRYAAERAAVAEFLMAR